MSNSVPTIEIIELDKRNAEGLGFTIRGGVDNIHVPTDPGVFVALIKPNGAAAKEGRLQVGDKILEIDDHDLREVPHQTAVSYFHNTDYVVKLLVERGAERRILDQLAASQSEVVSSTAQDMEDQSHPSDQQFSGRVPSSPMTWLTFVLVGSAIAISLFLILRKRQTS